MIINERRTHPCPLVIIWLREMGKVQVIWNEPDSGITGNRMANRFGKLKTFSDETRTKTWPHLYNNCAGQCYMGFLPMVTSVKFVMLPRSHVKGFRGS